MNAAARVLAAIEKETEKRFLPIIGREKGRLLVALLEKHTPKAIIELGALVGYSAILMASNSTAQITSIEISPQTAQVAQENVRKAGLEKRITVLVGDALEEIPQLEHRFDFAFIDAAKEQYLRYLKLLEPKLMPHAVIVADNVKMFANAMGDYLDYVRNSGNYRSRLHDFGYDGVEVSVR